MYAVSSDYKKAIAKPLINDRIAGTITLKDGTSLTISDKTLVKNSLKISHELCGDYRIGSFNLGCLQITVFDDNALLRDFTDAKICPVYEIETEAGWESVPMGIYLADGNSAKRKRNTISLTAYDLGSLFDKVIPNDQKTRVGNAAELIAAACQECGVAFGGMASGLPNTSVRVTAANRQIQTYRDFIAQCTVLLCGYAVIDRTGTLQILPAKYGVSDSDSSVILTDKLLTAAERDSIYVTDTRAYIKTLHALHDGLTATFLSNVQQPDEQAAPATYTLDENPILPDGLSQTELSQIYTDWLDYIDGFKQRGITAEIFGDPALDVGDVLRCSGGDIDQRRSIVGLVTKQEWRYRNLHTVICAAPQLSGKTSEYAAAVKSQTEKQLTALSAPYTAGKGIKISGKEISLKPAKSGVSDFSEDLLGGAYVDIAGGLNIDYDGRLFLRQAGRDTIGGVIPSDGIACNKGVISVNLGKGMNFNSPPPEEPQQDGTRRSISPKLGDGLEFIEYEEDDESEKPDDDGAIRLKLGKGLTFGENGEVIATGGKEYKAGENISITEDGTISAEVKEYTAGENITISEDGTISAEGSGVTIDQAVIIKEADAKYLLHNFTEIEYIAGNKIGYAGGQSPVIAQGMVVYKQGGTAPNGVTVAQAINKNDPNDLPDIPFYSDVPFGSPIIAYGKEYVRVYMKLISSINLYDTYNICGIAADGTETQIQGDLKNYDGFSYGFAFTWAGIYPPGSAVSGRTYEFGYARCNILRRVKDSATRYQVSYNTTQSECYIPFASLAEYQAAVGLTYEPLTLTQVEDNPTVVSSKNSGGEVT